MRELTIRPLLGTDLRRVEDMLWRLSDRSRYHRFFSQAASGVRAELDYLGSLDGHVRAALVADDGIEIIGMARYHGLTDDHAAVAVVVEDGWQGRGLGHRMMVALARAARREGFVAFEVEVLGENLDALRLLRLMSPRPRLHLDHGVFEATLPLAG